MRAVLCVRMLGYCWIELLKGTCSVRVNLREKENLILF